MKKTPPKTVENPFSGNFQEAWDLWKEYKQEAHKFKYKSSISEQMAINTLVKLSGGHEDVAIAIIEQSVANQWSGLFPLKNSSNVKSINHSSTRQSINEKLTKRFANG